MEGFMSFWDLLDALSWTRRGVPGSERRRFVEELWRRMWDRRRVAVAFEMDVDGPQIEAIGGPEAVEAFLRREIAKLFWRERGGNLRVSSTRWQATSDVTNWRVLRGTPHKLVIMWSWTATGTLLPFRADVVLADGREATASVSLVNTSRIRLRTRGWRTRDVVCAPAPARGLR
jgi:hypothetical protein